MADTLANRPPLGRAQPQGQPVRLATRYSRFVFLMKYLLPVIATVLVALVVMWPEIKSVKEGFRLGLGSFAGFDGGSGQRVDKARFAGRNSHDLPYTITADYAEQPEERGAPVRLEKPKADVTLADGTWLALSAAAGDYHKDSQLLALSGGVDLFHDAGVEFHTPRAVVDIEHGTAEGDQAAEGRGPMGRITGAGFRVLERGKRILFTGKARLELYGGGQGAGR